MDAPQTEEEVEDLDHADPLSVEAWRDDDGRLYVRLLEGCYEADDGTTTLLTTTTRRGEVVEVPADATRVWAVEAVVVVDEYLDDRTGEIVDRITHAARSEALLAAREVDDMTGRYFWRDITARHAWESFQANVRPYRRRRLVTRIPIRLDVRDVPRSDRACIIPLRSLVGSPDTATCLYIPPVQAMLNAAAERTGIAWAGFPSHRPRSIRFLEVGGHYVPWDSLEVAEAGRAAGIWNDDKDVHDYVGSYEECVACHDRHQEFFFWLFQLMRGPALRARRLEDVVSALEGALQRIDSDPSLTVEGIRRELRDGIVAILRQPTEEEQRRIQARSAKRGRR